MVVRSVSSCQPLQKAFFGMWLMGKMLFGPLDFFVALPGVTTRKSAHIANSFNISMSKTVVPLLETGIEIPVF